MTTYTPTPVLDAKAELGEHPVWSAAEQALYFLDIESLNIDRFEPKTGAHKSWTLPAKPGCFAFQADGTILLAAHTGIYNFDFSTSTAKLLQPAQHDPETMRFNDGKTDRQGRFWAGTVRTDMGLGDTAMNAYYRYDGKALEKKLTNIGVNNGTAFSPDGKTMYRAQTETRQVFAYHYDTATGTPTNQRLFTTIPEQYGVPDGATMDTEGFYWVALSALPGSGITGGVMRFSPDGQQNLYINLPIPFVTMPAFGGPDLSTLYLTTGSLSAFMGGNVPAHAGSIFAIETPFQGILETPFKG